MVDLTAGGGTDPKLVTTDMPRVSYGEAFNVTPRVSLAPDLAAIGEGLDVLSTKLAKTQAAEDLRKTPTLDANGMPQQNTYPFLGVGNAAAAYQHVIEAGTSAAMETRQRRDLADLRAANPEPQAFAKASEDYLQNQRQNYPGALGQQIYTQGDRIAAGHYDSLVNTQANADIAINKQSLVTKVSDGENRLYAMAANGQSGTPQFEQAAKDVQSARSNLVANKLFGYGAEKAKSDAADTEWRIKVMSAQSRIQSDRESGKHSYDEMNAGLQKLRDDPNSPLGADENHRLYLAGKARLDATSQAQQAAGGAIRTTVDQFEKAFADPASPKPTRDQIDTLAQQAIRDGAPDAFYRLKAMSNGYNVLSSMAGLTPTQKAQMLTGPQPSEQSAIAKMTSLGYSPTQAAAIVGGFVHESGGSRLNPNAIAKGDGRDGSDSIGIGQWNGPRAEALKAFAASRGKPWNDLETQLEFAHRELSSNEISAGTALKAAQTPEQAAAAMLAYERPRGWMAGGDPSLALGWSNRLAQTRRLAGGGASGNPIPFTPQQIAENPLIASTYLALQHRDQGKMAETGRAMGNAIVNAYDGGFAPSVAELAAFRQYAAAAPEQLGDLSRKVELTARSHEIARGLAPSATGGAASIAQADAYAAANPSIVAAEGASILRRQIEAEHQRFTADPYAWAARNGYVGRPPQPLDIANPAATASELHERGIVLAHMPPAAGQSFSLFRPGELDSAKAVMASGSLDQKIGFLTGLMRSGAPEPAMKATLAQLGSDSATRPLAIAGAVAREAPAVAHDILVGTALLKENPKLGPSDREAAPALWKALPQADFPLPAVRDGVVAAANGVYAKLSADANDLSGVLDENRMHKAIDAVTGGVLTFRGSKIFAPWYSASDGKLSDALHALTDQDMAGAITSDGQPFPAAALQSRRVGSSGNWRLQSYGDGKYLIYSGSNENRRYVQRNILDRADMLSMPKPEDRAFILDLGSKRTPVETAPPPVSILLPPPPVEPEKPLDSPFGKTTLPVSEEMGQTGKRMW